MATNRNDWLGLRLSGNRYEVTERLGRGGMGTVYKAKDHKLDADVVIKVPHASLLEDPGFAQRFQTEFLSLAKLAHPNIVKVTDVDAWEGVPFCVLQYLPGGSLEDRRSSGPSGFVATLDPRDVPKWLPGVARALDHVHGKGFVHRDVKPGNILFDPYGMAYLSDFGVIKLISGTEALAGPSQTGTGMVLGTAEYMAPEQVMGEAIDGLAADQYALAITVYEMLTGRRPFEEPVKSKLFVLHASQPVPPLMEFCSWITEPVSAAVLKGLSKNAANRYPSCAAFADAVGQAIAFEYTGKPERVRFRCPACKKTLALTPENFAKLKASGKSLNCSDCKAVVRGAADSTARWESSTGGTLSLQAFAAPVQAQASSPPRSPTTFERPGTTVERAGTMVERSGTMVESLGTVVESGLEHGLMGRPAATMREPALASKTGLSDIKLAALLSGVTLLVIVGAFFVFWGRSTPPAETAHATENAKPAEPVKAPGPPPAPPENRTKTAPTAPQAPPAPTTLPKPAELALNTNPTPKVEVAPEPKAEPVPTPVPKPKPAPETKPEPAPAPAPPPETEKVKEPEPTIEPLNKLVAIKTIVSDPELYLNKDVEAIGLSLIDTRTQRRSDGARTLALDEPNLAISKAKGLTGAVARPNTHNVLEVAPELASRLNQLDLDSPIKRLAVPTVRVTKSGKDWKLRIVKLELLRDYKVFFNNSGYAPDLRLNYLTQVIDADGNVTDASGAREKWNAPQRLKMLEDGLSRTFENYRRQVLQQQNMAIQKVQNNAAMNDFMAEMRRRANDQKVIDAIMSNGRR